MGQAFDRDGNVLGEAEGDTFREVLDKLEIAHKGAHEIRIKSLKDRLDRVEADMAESDARAKADDE
jgi:hypothetical protein